MPEREYFSLRYAIPGYIFILLIIGINHVPLLEILEATGLEATFGAFLAFLSLFTGSALGFLVSQFWWWWYKKKGGLFGIKGFEKALDTLIKKYKLKYELNTIQQTEDKMSVIAVFDYVSHSVRKEGKELHVYEERRWDMYHLLSSTLWSLGIGLGVGVLCRILSQQFLFEHLLSIRFWEKVKFMLESERAEIVVLTLIFVSVVLLILMLRKGIEWVAFEYSVIAEARIRRSRVSRSQIKMVFPDIIDD